MNRLTRLGSLRAGLLALAGLAGLGACSGSVVDEKTMDKAIAEAFPNPNHGPVLTQASKRMEEHLHRQFLQRWPVWPLAEAQPRLEEVYDHLPPAPFKRDELTELSAVQPQTLEQATQVVYLTHPTEPTLENLPTVDEGDCTWSLMACTAPLQTYTALTPVPSTMPLPKRKPIHTSSMPLPKRKPAYPVKVAKAKPIGQSVKWKAQLKQAEPAWECLPWWTDCQPVDISNLPNLK